MSDRSNAITAFWQVFQDHAPVLARLESADAPAYHEVLQHLQYIHPDLYFEFATGAPSHVVLTADGDRTLFDLVDEIAEAAPELSGWVVSALKPQLGFPTVTVWDGVEVALADVLFEPSERTDSDAIDLVLYVPGLEPEVAEEVHNALLRAIDHGLGERAFAVQVRGTNVAPLPEDVAAERLIPLLELERYLDQRRSKRR